MSGAWYVASQNAVSGLATGRVRLSARLINIQAKMQPWADHSPFLFSIAVFLFLWTFVPIVIGYVSGWASLAGQFRFRDNFSCTRWSWQNGQMRFMMNYNRCLTLRASEQGLSLAMNPLFRLGHPPLFIPWSEVSVQPQRILFFTGTRFQLGRENPVPLWVRQTLAEQLKRAAGNGWPSAKLENRPSGF